MFLGLEKNGSNVLLYLNVSVLELLMDCCSQAGSQLLPSQPVPKV